MWNLGVGVALAAVPACGPRVAVPGDEDDSGPDSVSGPVTGGPAECETRADCSEGYYCLRGLCVPEPVSDDHYYYEDSYYLDDGCYSECCYDYDCYYYDECHDDEDCGFGEICRESGYGYLTCLPAPLIEACVDSPALIPLPVAGGGGEITSLNFVDANGDNQADLAIGYISDVELVLGPGLGQATTLSEVAIGETLKVADGDFNGDAYRDLALIDRQAVTVLAGAEDGTFSPAGQVATTDDPLDFFPLNWDGQGADDVVALTELWEVPVVAGAALDLQYALDPANARKIAVGDFDGDGLDDVVSDGLYDVRIVYGNGKGDVSPDVTFDHDGTAISWSVAGRFDPAANAVLVRLDVEDATLLEAHSSTTTYTPQLLDAGGDGDVEVGDIDGDGVDDLVMLTAWGVTIAFGGPGGEDNGLFRCQTTVDPDFPAAFLALGDLDGDGRADIALSDGEVVNAYSTL